MSELKPKRDDHMATGKPDEKPRASDAPRPHGDKLQSAFDSIPDSDKDAAEKPRKS